MQWGGEMADHNQQQQPSSSSDALLPATIKQNSASRAFAVAPTKALAAIDLNTIVHHIYINKVSATGKARTSMSLQCRQEASNSDLCTTTTIATSGKMQKMPNGSRN